MTFEDFSLEQTMNGFYYNYGRSCDNWPFSFCKHELCEELGLNPVHDGIFPYFETALEAEQLLTTALKKAGFPHKPIPHLRCPNPVPFPFDNANIMLNYICALPIASRNIEALEILIRSEFISKEIALEGIMNQLTKCPMRLLVSEKFSSLLNNLCDGISENLLHLSSASVNFLDYEDNKISFLNKKAFLTMQDDPWTSTKRISMKPIRFVKKYFPSIELNELDIDEFVAGLKAGTMVTSNLEFKIVSGDEIITYYHNDSYAPQNESMLWQSCMRYDECSEYMDIYTQNSQVKLAVLLKKGLLVARSLIWDNKYFDRIYAWNTCYEKYFESQLSQYQKIWESGLHVTIELDDGECYTYPYLDSFQYLDGNTISTKNYDLDDYKTLINTDGSWN